MRIDIEKLREDMMHELYGAYFGGGFGAALTESFNVRTASPEELVKKAISLGMDLREYEC